MRAKARTVSGGLCGCGGARPRARLTLTHNKRNNTKANKNSMSGLKYEPMRETREPLFEYLPATMLNVACLNSDYRCFSDALDYL
jgi:hypothetical protein